METASQRAAVLVIRVWVEADAPAHLRARLLHVPDVTAADATWAAWLEAFLQSAARGPGGAGG